MPVRERVVRFGLTSGLAGILSTPRRPRHGTPYIVLVNAGIVHRVGPNRLYVDIARALSAIGFSALRFDLSGIGDSDAIAGGASLAGSAVSDVRAALDYLERSRQARSFVICGLCSGADYSMLTSFSDARVVGTILIDPSVKRTRRSRLIHHARRLRHAATWSRVIRLQHPIWGKSLRRLRGLTVVQAAESQSEQHADEYPTSESEPQVRLQLKHTIERGVQLMLVFTGGVNQQYNYRNQLFDLLPGFDFRDQLRLEFMPETDHSVSDGPSRAALLRAICDWMCDRFSLAERAQEIM
jgi:alpha-beta hydrolase superfamily lysophospholipase